MEEILIILMGLIIGSFLNVVIHRLPLGQSIVKPGSHCPRCQRPIPFYDNIPVVSYLLLGGKCRGCRQPISPRYPLVEMLTGLCFWLSYLTFGPSLHTAFTILFLCLLIALAFIDLQHMILPDSLTLGGALVFLGYAFVHPWISAQDAILSALTAAALFAGLYFFYLKVRKIEGLGFGDIKMMLLLGLFLGHRMLIVAILVASFSGLLAGFFFILFKKKDLKFALPFGTFLSLGSMIAVFWGDSILGLIQSLIQPQ